MTRLFLAVVTVVANVIVVDALVSLPLTKTIRGTSALNLFEKDKIRIKALQAHAHFHGSSKELGEPITNEVSNYRASVSATAMYSLLRY